MENLGNKKLIRAKHRVDEIKKFYKHIVAYILVNLFLAFVWNFSFKLFGNFIVSNQFDGDSFTHIPIWLIWGVFLALHGIKTFGFPNLFGKDWEQKKIDEFMNE
ncbi:2TM domain-containing protein [Polaribacter sp. PL03]|uniref:2TM domain-containing protein n=1 Tax=Polaribacter sp. PL03 TaxID=3088353 RepID=UPI0029CD52A6|nr:2TM domain-containing protein [Polaribacter sp. PL03]MDX6746195.1 2TM domain-containing protein [Polaribacter sp. PL03]